MNKKQLFEKYITTNLDSAYRFAYTYTKNKYDAEDVVSESIIKALNAAETIRSPEYIKSWFYKIIANTAINNLKKKNRFDEFSEKENEISMEDDHSQIDLQIILDKLEVKYREIIVLRFMEDMTIKEIAQVTGINESTVKTRLYRALEILKVEMGDEVFERV